MNQNQNKPHSELSDHGTRSRQGKERRPRRRWLFLFMDVVLVLAILGAILFIASLLTPFSFSGGEKAEVQTIAYTVELAGVDSATLSALHQGDIVTDLETGAVLGKVDNIEIRAYQTFGSAFEHDSALDTNVVTRIEYPDTLKTVVVTIRTDAEYVPGVGYAVEECRIAVGRAYTLCFPGYIGSGVCISFVK